MNEAEATVFLVTWIAILTTVLGGLIWLEISPPKDNAKGLEADIIRAAIKHSGLWRLGVTKSGNTFSISTHDGISIDAIFKDQKVVLWPVLHVDSKEIVIELAAPDGIERLGHHIGRAFRCWRRHL